MFVTPSTTCFCTWKTLVMIHTTMTLLSILFRLHLWNISVNHGSYIYFFEIKTIPGREMNERVLAGCGGYPTNSLRFFAVFQHCQNIQGISRPYLVVVTTHDDVIKWKHFPRNWPFMRGIHRSPVNSPHKGQWRGALMFTLICARINGWVNTREAGDLRRYRPHYDVIVMS